MSQPFLNHIKPDKKKTLTDLWISQPIWPSPPDGESTELHLISLCVTLDFNLRFQTEIMHQITTSWYSQNEATLTFSGMGVDPISFEESF